MQTIYKPSVSKKLIASVIIVIALVGVGAYGAHHYNFWPFNPPATKQDPTSQTNSKSESYNPQAKTDSQKADSNPNVDTNKTTNQVPASPNVSVAITQLSEQDGNIIYSADITNPGISGTCSAVFTSKIDRPVTHTENAEGPKCGPTTIPATTFTSLGEWTLTLRYYTNNTQATAIKTIIIK